MFPTAALEDIEDVIDPQVPVTSEEVEVVINDLQKDDAECAAIETDIERFESTAVTMESMLQHALPLTQKATDADVRHLTTAVCAVASSSRFSVGPTLALEAIEEQTAEQRGAGVIAKIKEYALRLWSMLTDALERVMDWFSQFLQKITGASARLKKRSDALIKRASATSTHLEPDAEKSLTGRVASLLGVVDGTPQAAVKNLSVFVKGLVEAGRGEYFNPLYKAVEKLANNESADDEINDFVKEIQKTYNPLFEYEAPDIELKGGESIEIGCSEVLPGNYHGYMAIPKDPVGLGYFRYELSNSLGSLTQDQGLPVLSISDAEELLKNVRDIAETYQNVEHVEADIQRVKERLVKARGIIEKSLARDKTASFNPSNTEAEKIQSAFRVQVMRGLLSFVPRATAGIHQKTMSFAVARCQSAVYWAEWSLSQYSPKAA